MNPTGRESCHVLDDAWLTRYPKPVRIIFDQGTEYKNICFESHLMNLGIKAVPCTVKNPQSNAILERVHDVIKTSLRTEIYTNHPQDAAEAREFIDRILASAQYAARCTIHKTYGVSPGSLVFNRDMLLPIPIITDLNILRSKRQAIIDQNNLRDNRRRRNHDYVVGDQIMLIKNDPAALEDRNKGLYTITQVHANGTVTFMRNEEVFERINVRRIKPYYALL